jgi:hypothetical protein
MRQLPTEQLVDIIWSGVATPGASLVRVAPGVATQPTNGARHEYAFSVRAYGHLKGMLRLKNCQKKPDKVG